MGVGGGMEGCEGSASSEPATPHTADPAHLPPGWAARVDETYGRTYYFDSMNKKDVRRKES